MYFIKDPNWYLENQNKMDKIYSNVIFLFLSLYMLNKNKILSILFFMLFVNSTLFHVYSNKFTLALDRISMVLLFSYYFHLFYEKIPFHIYSILGIITIYYWFVTENLLYYFLYQLLGLLIFLIYTPIDIFKKIIIIQLYLIITYSQVLKKGKFHSIKHILLGLLSIYIYNLITRK